MIVMCVVTLLNMANARFTHSMDRGLPNQHLEFPFPTFPRKSRGNTDGHDVMWEREWDWEIPRRKPAINVLS